MGGHSGGGGNGGRGGNSNSDKGQHPEKSWNPDTYQDNFPGTSKNDFTGKLADLTQHEMHIPEAIKETSMPIIQVKSAPSKYRSLK